MTKVVTVGIYRGAVEIDREGSVPPYQQIAAYLREQIMSGQIPADRPVPSKRYLIETFGVAGRTVDKAIELLRADGLVRTVRGMGIYVVPETERPGSG